MDTILLTSIAACVVCATLFIIAALLRIADNIASIRAAVDHICDYCLDDDDAFDDSDFEDEREVAQWN